MKLIELEEKVAVPENAMVVLKGKSIEEQLKHFVLSKCYDETYYIDTRTIKEPEKTPGKVMEISDDTPILVSDGIVVGIRVEDMDIYTFTNPRSEVISFGGHRTSMDYWYFEEYHRWYIFKFIGEMD